MIIRSNGELWAWGWNRDGQVGDGTTEARYSPVFIMDDVTAVSTGESHTIAIRSDGSLWAWGSNSNGQLGNGTRVSSYIPVWVMDDVIAVTAGLNHTMAVRSDGSLWAWGNGVNGRLGLPRDEYPQNVLYPAQVMDAVLVGG